MVVADGRDERLVDDHARLEADDRRARHTDQGEVQAAGAQPVDEVVGVGLGQGQGDAGMLGVEGLEQVGDVRQAAGDDHPDRHVTAQEAAVLVDGAARALDGLERRARVREERLPHRSEPDRASGAVEQLLPDLALEPPDLGADTRLRDVDACGGLGEARLLGDRDEVLELAKFHKR